LRQHQGFIKEGKVKKKKEERTEATLTRFRPENRGISHLTKRFYGEKNHLKINEAASTKGKL
jgi:hypothetical protein